MLLSIVCCLIPSSGCPTCSVIVYLFKHGKVFDSASNLVHFYSDAITVPEICIPLSLKFVTIDFYSKSRIV